MTTSPNNPSSVESNATPAPASPAATVILMRPGSPDSKKGFEVLLLLRARAVQFAGNTWVFPGGRIDEDDYQGHPDDVKAAARFAAARESLEEASLQLDPEDFHFFSHWTTPLAEKKRFSTWFLLGCLHEHQHIAVDDGEIVAYQWLKPSEALAKHRKGELMMLPPAFMTLRELSQCSSMEEAISLTQERELPRFFPNMVKKNKALTVLLAGDAGYESGELDHHGSKDRLVMSQNGWDYISDC